MYLPMLNDWIVTNTELERIWKETLFTVLFDIWLEGLGRTTKDLSLDNGCLGQDSNFTLSEYKPRAA
jgi:hypothetical protein